jgi:hypothetical protein
MQARTASLVATAALVLQACAASTQSGPAALAETASATPPSAPSKAGYVLNAEELALDCKKLTGRMQVRILQVRDYRERDKTTLVSRGMQVATSSVIGGTQEGVYLDSRYEKDRAVLEAYNRQLAAKKCKTFDLEAELKAQPIAHTPTPVAKPAPAYTR